MRHRLTDRPAATISLFAFALLAPSVPALANDGTTLDEVIVSAERRTAATSDISAAISVVDDSAIRTKKLITDALAESVGVYLQQTTPGQGAAIIRGLKGSSILHLVDGMRLNNAIFRSAPTQYFALVPVTAVRQIETLRGTPTSLYGSDAVGGIVQVVTRVPEFDAAATAVRGDVYAAFDSAELGKTLRGTLDIGNRDVASSFSLEHLRTGNRRTGGGERIGPSGYDMTAARAVMSIKPDDRRHWTFDLHYLEQPETPRVDELVTGFGQDEPSSSEYLFAPNRRLFAHARYDHANGWLDADWRVSLGWQRIDDDRITRNFGSDVRVTERNRSDLSGALLTASKSSERLSWVAGIEAYHDRVRSDREQLDIPDGARQVVTPRFPDGASIDQAAVFVNLDVPLAGRHAISGGLRFSSVHVDTPQNPVLPAVDIDITDISGDLGWRFQLDDNWQLVANAGFGFRAPNVFDLGTFGNRPGNRFNVPNASLDSEHVVQLDIGARWRGKRSKFELVLYGLDYDDRIVSVSTGDTTADGRDIVRSVNAATSTIVGVEFGGTVTLTEKLSLQVMANYSRGEQKLVNGEEPADRIPPLTGRLTVDYESGGPLGASIWIKASDDQRRLSARDVRDVRIDPDGTAGWTIAGVEARWRMATGWELALGIDNLLDERYRSHGSGIDASGRSLSASARYAW